MSCRIARRPAAATLLALAVLAGVAASGSAGTAERLDALLARYHEIGLFDGVALIVRADTVLVEQGYGLANREFSVPNAPDTKLWIGSVTKVFTATMVARLADAGRLSLEDRVGDRLPWYRQDTGQRMTLRQLLGHSAGLPDYMHLPGIEREGFARAVGDSLIDLRTFVRDWCSADLQWEPGSRWGYSNSGYVLLGAVIEAATGMPYAQALDSLILAPAGMRDSGDLARRPHAVVPGLSPGYERFAGEVVTRRFWNVSTAYAAGSMVATVGDLRRFDQLLARRDFLSPASREAMFTPGPGNWGAGWSVQTAAIGPGQAPRTLIGHEGFLYWTLTQIYRIPEDDTFIVLANNSGNAPFRTIFAGLFDLLYGREPAWPQPAAAEAVHALAAQQGAPAAIARYCELQRTAPADYEFSEGTLNALGYALLQEGRPQAAVGIFRFTVESFPASGNAWDSLGEGLAGLGEREEAIRAYRRALELAPDNANAKAWLARLSAGGGAD
jgi:CubicO group peptidase (beta-lactamase class C family)